MRSVVVFSVLAALTAWEVVRHLPEREAVADVSHARPQVGSTVESVALDGDELPMAALRAVLATHVGDALAPTKLVHDRAALEAALVARGYLEAHVAPAQVLPDGDAADVTFDVRPGRPFVIGRVAVVGASDRDAGVVTLAPGELVVASRLAEARQALSARLAARGKPHLVTLHVTPDPANATADVELQAGD